MTDLLLGIDVGTSSTKGVLTTLNGTVVRQSQVPHGMSVPRPGYAEQDADEVWWADVVRICRTLVDDDVAGRIAGVGISAIGPCLLPLDAQRRPLRPAILYGVDVRATEEIELLEQQHGREALVGLGGMRLTSQAIGPKILWLRRHERDVYDRAAYFVTASSYIVMRLSGEVAIDRHTASHFNPLFDFDRLEWADQFADGIAATSTLPRLGWSDEVAGTVTDAAAAETGLRVGTPVTVGAVDALAEAVSVGVVEPGDLMLMYGSTAFMILVTDGAASAPTLWATAGAFEGTRALAAGLATSGSATTWFRDQLARDLAEDEDPYGRLAAEAASSPPGARGLLALPYFSGERTPLHDADARAVFAGLSLAHTRADLYRALLEGVGAAIAHNVDVMAAAAPISRVVAVGGGSLNRLWLQVVSDMTGRAQELPAQSIGASYGDAFLAGVATGRVDRGALASTWVTNAEQIVPDPATVEVYAKRRRLFHALYEQSADVVHALARE